MNKQDKKDFDIVRDAIESADVDHGLSPEEMNDALAALDRLESQPEVPEDVKEVAKQIHEECYLDTSQSENTRLVWDIDIAANLLLSWHNAQVEKLKAMYERQIAANNIYYL